jgi:hypothetical protein
MLHQFPADDFAMIGSRRIHLPIGIVWVGWRVNTKEERHEKEVQEEIEGNVKKCDARKVRLSPPVARKA